MKPSTLRGLIATLTICVGSASADIIVTTDSSTVFEGNFSFDAVNDGLGLAVFANTFSHLSFDGAGNGQFQVNLNLDGDIELQGYDFSLGVPEGIEVYAPPVVDAYRSGTFSSLFDGSDIQYEYSNVDTSTPIVTGNFKYSVVPEPATISLISISGLFFLFGRRLSKRKIQ